MRQTLLTAFIIILELVWYTLHDSHVNVFTIPVNPTSDTTRTNISVTTGTQTPNLVISIMEKTPLHVSHVTVFTIKRHLVCKLKKNKKKRTF